MTPVTVHGASAHSWGVRVLVVALLASGLGGAWLLAQAGVARPARAADAASEDAYRANNLGVAYLEQYNYEAAAKSFRHALEIDPALAMARVNLAIALLYVPDLSGATREAQAALQAQPDSRQARYVLGLAARGENRVDDGVAAFQQLLTVDPDDPGTLVNLGQLYLQERKFDEAIGLFRKAIAAEPFNATATYNLAVSLMRAGKQEEGQKLTAQFQQLRESGHGVTYANTYLEQGRYGEALASTGAEPELVDRATPAVAFTGGGTIEPAAYAVAAATRTARSAAGAAADAAAAMSAGGFALADIDGDGDLDIVDVSPGRVRLLTNDRGNFVDTSAKAGLDTPGSGSNGTRLSAIVGDYDNDRRADIFILGATGDAHALLHQTDGGRFEDLTSRAGLAAAQGAERWQAAAFVDVDHDGDLDIVMAGAPGVRLMRNNGDGTFTDTTAEAKLTTANTANGNANAAQSVGIAIVPTDYDNRRDIDLLFLFSGGRAPALFRNMRDGTFRDEASSVGLSLTAARTSSNGSPVASSTATATATATATRYSAVAAGDVNKDGFTDFFFGRSAQQGVLFLSDGNGHFRAADQGPTPQNAIAAQFIDYDNDGLLDLVGLTPGGLFVWRNLGTSWIEVSSAALKDAGISAPSSLAAGDIDGDGDTDLIVKSTDGKLTILTNEGGNKHSSLRVRLAGQVSNRSGIGAKIDVRAGSLRQKLEFSSTTPAIAPADLTFGLGSRARADVVRVLWPSGTVQAEAVQQDQQRQRDQQAITITELDRKPSSCPFLYTWNGERFEFITDFMGGGEMGYLEAPGIRNVPDPEEFTRITDSQLRPHNGRYELRVTNELEETLFVDRQRLLAIAHPADVELYPREGLVSPPFPRFEVIAARDTHAPARVTDQNGHDVTERARALDRRFIDDIPLDRIRGYAKPHDLTIDAEGADLLLLTGWTDYAFSSDNIAASHAGLHLEPPSLAVQDDAGVWQTVIEEIGIPVGRPQTIAVDLKGKWLSSRRVVRIHTSMRVYWDQIQVATRDRAFEPQMAVVPLDPIAADLHWRGYSAEATREEPFTYDYSRVSTSSSWKQMPGRYTREGDVRELLRSVDDMFVIARPGDEIALSFDASTSKSLPAGWKRTFLLHSDGFSKEMDLHSASPDQAWPLPFHTMTRYPYDAPESYPFTPERLNYLERYNTRIISRMLPSIDAPLSQLLPQPEQISHPSQSSHP